MTVAAFIVSLIAVAISVASVWYGRRADQRAVRAEARADRAEARAEAQARVEELERIGEIVRELADAARTAQTDPMGGSRVQSIRSRLLAVVEVSGFYLPRCGVFVQTVAHGDLVEAEQELAREIANAREA